MKTLERKDGKTIFGAKDVVYFGYSRGLNGAMNMAVDEVLLRKADEENRFFLRFYDVDRPTVILSSSDDYNSAIKPSNRDTEVYRRMSGGRPIYLDNNTLEYSIAGPLRKDDQLNGAFDPVKLHRALSPFLAAAIGDMMGKGHEITFGNTSSIRVGNKPIAGHAQMILPNHSFLYQGIIVIYPWNIGVIESALNLPKEDLREIPGLPCLYNLAATSGNMQHKEELVGKMLLEMPAGNLRYADDDQKAGILRAAESLSASKYAAREWIHRETTKQDVRFCILES